MARGGARQGSGRPSEKSQVKLKGEQLPPKKPDDLNGEHANALWDEAVVALSHVLRPVDFAILRLACEAFELAMTDGCPKVRLSASRAFEAMARQIGLTPSSRRVIKPVDGEQSEEVDPLAKWMERGGLN